MDLFIFWRGEGDVIRHIYVLKVCTNNMKMLCGYIPAYKADMSVILFFCWVLFLECLVSQSVEEYSQIISNR